jgi:hypothetical protein
MCECRIGVCTGFLGHLLRIETTRSRPTEPKKPAALLEPGTLRAADAVQLVDRRGDQPGTRRAKRMVQRNCATVGFDALDARLAKHGQALGGEGLVELDHIHLRKRQASARQRLEGGRCVANAHDARQHARSGHADNTRSGIWPWRDADRSLASTNELAPSVTPLALPAVTVPSGRTKPLSLLSASRLVSRGCSSRSTTMASLR